MVNLHWMLRAWVLLLLVTTLSACTTPTRIKPKDPSLASAVTSDLDISDVVFDFKQRENKTYEAVMRNPWSVDQRVLAEPTLAQFIQDDMRDFVNLHTHLDPMAPTTIHVTITKAQVIVYKLPVLIPLAGGLSRGIGAESNVQISRMNGQVVEASCEFSDVVKGKHMNDLTPERYRVSVENVVTLYRQTLVNELEKRCASVFESQPNRAAQSLTNVTDVDGQ